MVAPLRSEAAILRSVQDRLTRVEQSLSENIRILYGNDQQFKAGLESSETNQRAVAKVVEDVVKVLYNHGGSGVLKPEGAEDGTVDWKHYYDTVSAEMRAEQLSQYRVLLGQMVKKAEMVEGMLPKFEARVQDELSREAASVNGDKAKSASKFINDVRAQIVRIRKADEAAKNPEAEVQVDEFNDADTLFNYVIGMHRRMEAEEKKKAEEAAKAAKSATEGEPVIVSASEDDVRVFGG